MTDQPDIPEDYAEIVRHMEDTNNGKVLTGEHSSYVNYLSTHPKHINKMKAYRRKVASR